MKRYLSIGLLAGILMVTQRTKAQYESIVQEGEFGLSAGAAHYFGDLNTDAHLNRPKLALGAFFRKQFGNYIALRVGAHFAQLGYSDVYNKDNDYQKRRNLSFNTNIWELSATIPMLISRAKRFSCVRLVRKGRVLLLIPIVNHTAPWLFVFPLVLG